MSGEWKRPTMAAMNSYNPGLSNSVKEPPMRISFWRDTIWQKEIPVILLIWGHAIRRFESFRVFRVKSTVFPIKKSSDYPLVVAVVDVHCNIVWSKITMREDNFCPLRLMRVKLMKEVNKYLTTRVRA